ncbi:sigma-E factor negative regulatory protein [Roseateles violae]|uniref:Sigma-E factor negative regulatory protein n=1 Tax=Roseateles violae TaxID=3058042 RepID=A0ABT8DWT4_9BURK|nr:sigma-E factor negative regulatory protein [Pelomonas sp. PFR6]MDN3920927.1 sigma-E factor negative regulatory protein [Pelomonas sp. PFR6]
MKHEAVAAEDLSDLLDGRASPAQLRALCAAWADDAELRRSWQAWHLLGDSLRSAELVGQAQRSEALLDALHQRLAQEPPRSATQPLARWLAPLAVAAGFVGLALLMPGLRPELPQSQLQVRALPNASLALLPAPGGLMLDRAAPSFAQTMTAPVHPALLGAAAPLPDGAGEVTSGAPAR